MSKTKRSYIIVFLLTLLAVFVVGCKKETTPVEDIYFNLGDEQIVLLKGDELNIENYVTIQPSYASNKTFTLVSGNENILSVDNKVVRANEEGVTQLKVISKDNEIKQDVITVSVKSSQTTLNTPDVNYNPQNATFNFNAVPNATSYTLKLNGKEIEIGNTTTYSLPTNCYNNIAVVQVKANSPIYSHAFVNSQYSNELKIYQASAVENANIKDGVLSYDKISNSKFKVLLNNEELTTTNSQAVDLTRLDERFAGLNTTLQIQTIVNEEIKKPGVIYYDSSSKVLPINVLDVANLKVNGTIISWQNISNASGYDLYVSDVIKAQNLTTNNFDLQTLADFSTKFENAENIKVVPTLKNTTNVASTTKTTQISVKKLPATNIYCEGYDVKWNAIEKASTYLINLTKGEETIISSSMPATSISLQNKDAGDYDITVQVVATNEIENGVYYISSNVEKLEFTKLASLNANISNYVLNINNFEADDDLEIYIDSVDFSNKFNNNLDLTNEVFEAGEHIVKIKRSRSDNFIDSDITTKSFVQLEKIASATVSKGVVKVNRSTTNSNATIKLITTGSKIEDIEITDTTYTYNTTTIGENYLPAGDDYKTEVYVLGDGSETFSYRELQGESLTVVPNCYVEFEVLSAPKNFAVNKATAELTFDNTSNKYKIYTVGSNAKQNLNTNSCNVVGGLSYKIQAIGNGITTLDSVLSDEITIVKLNTPTLKFNNVDNTITRGNTNTVGYNGEYVYTHKLSGEENSTEIDFDTVIDYTVPNSHTFTLQEIAIDNDLTNKIFYLNSDVCSLKITKIANSAGFTLKNNKLEIATTHGQEYALNLEFDCNGTIKTYTLSNTQQDLEYTYSSNKYVITLIDEDYNAIVEEMLNGFKVKAKFIPAHIDAGDNVITSEFTDYSETLNFTKISSASTITINSQNKIVINPENHTKQYYLRVVIDGENFVSKGSTLVNSDESIVLNYTYAANSYTIDILDENYERIITTLGDSFDVKVKYSYNADGLDTDLDSEYSNAQTLSPIKISSTSTITTNIQNKIVIKPEDHTRQYYLTVEINGEEFVSKESTLVNDDESIVLNYTYAANSYIIDILDENYEPIITTLGNSFDIKVKYSYNADGMDAYLDSEYSNAQTITFLTETSLIKDGQNLKFKNVNTTYNYSNYAFIVNNSTTLLYLNDTCVTSGDYIVVDANYIFNNAGNIVDGVNTVRVITINKENNVTTLAKKGEEISIEKAQAIELSYTKDNTVAENSAIVEFNTYDTEYAKKYIIEINGTPYTFLDRDAEDYKISIILDDIELGKTTTIEGYVICDQESYASTIYVFNSNKSNTLTIGKIDAPTGVSVSGTTLSWTKVKNAVGYEIYVVNGTNYVKQHTNLITTNSYNVEISSQTTFVIKAISKTKNLTNSSYSENIIIDLMPNVFVSTSQGRFKVDLNFRIISLVGAGVSITPRITNGDKTVDLNMADLELDGMSVYIEPHDILNYSGTTVLAESLNYGLVVNSNPEGCTKYYINSKIDNIKAYGLFAPVDIQKTVDQNKVEFISWSNNSKNVLDGVEIEEIGYIVKINYNGVDYYTNDENLKYKSGENYYSYASIIESLNIVFPYGYDNDNNGTIDVEFGAGVYKISVQTMPKGGTDKNYCKSAYTTTEYTFEIMNTVNLTVNNGVLTWEPISNATSYQVFIYENDSTTLLTSGITSTNTYDFNSNSDLTTKSGVFKVSVKALSNTNNVLNSVESAPIHVYRLPKVNSFAIDDGKLIITATNLFTKADITFVYKNNSGETIDTKTITYTNDKADANLAALGISSWENLTKTISTSKYEINLESLIEGYEYSVSVKLYGNTSMLLGLLNSEVCDDATNSKTIKLKTNRTDVTTGVIEFKPDTAYTELTDININYAFNKTPYTTNGFFNKTKIYKININSIDIYAVDYFNFIEHYGIDPDTIGDSEVENVEYYLFNKSIINTNDLCGYVIYTCEDSAKIYFNIYKDNIINLRDYDYLYYYQVEEKFDDGVNELYCTTDEYKILDLAAGGSFATTICMLGGDSNEDKSYISSNVNNIGVFVRYGENSLTTYQGKVQFNNLVKDVDNPVYKIIVKPISNEGGELDKIFYIYHTNEAEAKTIASRLDANFERATYVPVEILSSDTNKIIFDLSNYIDVANYKVSIRTLAGVGVGDAAETAHDFLLNAKEPTVEYIYKKLANTMPLVNNGVIEFEQSYILEDGEKIYYNNYEITLFDGTETFVYVINSTSDGVSVNSSSHIIKYVMPSAITYEAKTFTINPDKQYTIKIKAISNVDYIVNGTYVKELGTDKVLEFTKSKGVSNVRIEDGLLKWTVNDLDNYVQSVIKIGNGGENIIINGGTAFYDGGYQYHYFEFGDGKYNLETSGTAGIEAGINYTVSIRTIGKNNILNSDYTSSVPLTRLATVDASSILTNTDGYLTWTVINGANGYEVIISEIGTIAVEDNNLDLSTLSLDPAKTYNIKIKAIGTNIINAANSTEVSGFVKLNPVLLNSVKVTNNYIEWDTVADATGYKVEFIYTPTSGVVQPATIVTENKISAPTNISGTFTIKITAVGMGKTINSTTTQYISSTEVPEPVNSVEFDETNSRYVINVDLEKFLSGDKLQITYNFVEETATGSKTSVTITDQIEYQNNVSTYYYKITKIGTYSNFAVQVTRANSVASSVKEVANVNFNLFSYGDGSDENPYRIGNATQLLNISYFKNANYILISSINMRSVNYAARLSTYNAIISDEFGGVLDGNSFSIFGFNTNQSLGTDTINVSDVNNFALFGQLNSAEIKNLTIGEENIQMILTNTFANNNSNVVNLSLIATGANNSTISNINVMNLKIVLNSNATLSGEIYISGLIAQATNTKVENSNVNVTTQINVNFTNNVYMSGVVAKASGTTDVNGCEVNFTALSSNKNYITYLGGAVAYYDGNVQREHGISNTTVELSIDNVKASYIGGLVALARNVKVNSSSTSGSITYSGINYDINLGGLFGVAQNSDIEDCGTTAEFTITVNNTSNKNIGAIAGKLTLSGTVSNCYVNGNYNFTEKSIISTSGITLGIYGYKDAGVVITKATN